MPPDIRVIWDESDRIDTSTRIFQFGQDRADTMVIYPTLEGGEAGFARELLVALGKDLDLLPKRANQLVQAARYWTLAEEIRDVIVYGAHRLLGILYFLEELEARIWLVTPKQAGAEELAKPRRTVESVNELIAHFEATRQQPPTAAKLASPAFPRIPYNDFFTFIPSAKSMHGDGDSFGKIVRTFREAMRGASEFMIHEPGRTSESIRSHVHQTMLNSDCIRSAVCRLRGIQATLFLHRIYLKVNLLPLLALWRMDTTKGDQLEISSRLRRFVDPTPGVIASLASISNLMPFELTKLRREQVADDGSSVRTSKGSLRVPEDLRAFFRCYLAIRDSRDTSGDQSRPFLIDPKLEELPMTTVEVDHLLRSCDLKNPARFIHGDRSMNPRPQSYAHLQLHNLQPEDGNETR